jgi:hypothetical protein
VLLEKYGQEVGTAAGAAARAVRSPIAKRDFGPSTLIDK